MAHITLKLIWYRLGETFDKMAAASENITSWLDWDDHLLDFLLFGWIGWAALVVLVVNAVLTFFEPLQPQREWARTKEGVPGKKVAATGGAESCVWLNSALNWFYLHYDRFPEFVDVWVKALNEQSVKLGGPVQVKFERVKSGSLPPKFSEVTFEAGPEDKYVLHCKTDSRDVSMAVFASQQTTEGVKLTNLTTNILRLKGSLKMKCFREGQDMMVNVGFEGRPDVKVIGKPVNPYQDPNDLVDVGVVETVVRNAICLTSSTFNITKMLTGSSGNLTPRIVGDKPVSPVNLSPRTEAVFEPIEVKETQQSAFHAPSLASAPMLSSAPRPSRPTPGDKRLLVKVIKASALGGRDVGSVDPTCVVVMDSPPQSQATSVVKSTVNPFWDEQFLFDITNNTREVKFEVVDRRKPAGENFLGEAYAYYEDLKRTPSSRQIIPLQGNPALGGDMVTGSITVEFLFLDAIEAESVRQTMAAMSPKRTVEVNQAKTPGGTLVTKTTTTTERSRHGRQDAIVDGSPNYIEKHTNMYDYDGSDTTSHTSPNASLIPHDRSVSSSSEQLHFNGIESIAETAIRELMDRSRNPRTPTKTSTLIITGVKRTTQSSPTEEVNSDVLIVRTEPPAHGHEEREKKKGLSLAQSIKKRFSRSKKRSKSAERSRDDSHLHPRDQTKDDIELVRAQPDTPSLKKSRSLGGSLKKLFRRGRKRSRDHGETSRDSSYSRSSTRNASQGPSREGSITRGGGGQSSSLTRSGQLPDQKGDMSRGHWSKSTPKSSTEYMEREIDVSPRHPPSASPTYPTLQQEPTVLQPRGYPDPQMDVSRGHRSRPGEQTDVVRPSYDTNSAPSVHAPPSEDVRRGHWSKSKITAGSGAVIITTPKREPLDVVTPSYDTMSAPPEKTTSREKIDTDVVNPVQEPINVVPESNGVTASPSDTPSAEVTTPKTPDGGLELRRGHWTKSNPTENVHIGPVIISKEPTPATTDSVDPEIRKGHWTKSKSKSPKRDMSDSGRISGGGVIIVSSSSPQESKLPSPPEDIVKPKSSEKDKAVSKQPVKVKIVKVVPIKPERKEPVSPLPVETVPEKPLIPPPAGTRRGHWSKSDTEQPTAGGMIVVSTEPSAVPPKPVEPVDIRKGHWTKPKTS